MNKRLKLFGLGFFGSARSSRCTAVFHHFLLVGRASVFQLANIRSSYASSFFLFDSSYSSDFDPRDSYQIQPGNSAFFASLHFVVFFHGMFSQMVPSLACVALVRPEIRANCDTMIIYPSIGRRIDLTPSHPPILMLILTIFCVI
ncbi:hypothetical protein BDN70DRAFT_375721 [Pholiota conissans]|uniref:Uncharacterized protein n=1 Tax=Pholiota conissans TaxID=109636 RepID=A0A9P6CUW1_9AGAR|nr:hypothetical protein BDN70DRAFT_375721 [Pholiota conissans]